MSTLQDLISKQSPESQARIKSKANEMHREIILAKLRNELQISQSELAIALGVKQPTVARMEQIDNDPRLSTLKRYIEALGGELSIEVNLPTGKRIAFHI